MLHMKRKSVFVWRWVAAVMVMVVVVVCGGLRCLGQPLVDPCSPSSPAPPSLRPLLNMCAAVSSPVFD